MAGSVSIAAALLMFPLYCFSEDRRTYRRKEATGEAVGEREQQLSKVDLYTVTVRGRGVYKDDSNPIWDASLPSVLRKRTLTGDYTNLPSYVPQDADAKINPKKFLTTI